MGNYRFKLSYMIPIPNAWFHKLKYKNSTTTTTKNQNSMQSPKKKNHAKIKSPSSSSVGAATHHQRKSYHFARDLPPTPDDNLASQHSDSPTKPLRKRSSIKKNRPSIRSTSPRLASVSADHYSCRASLEDDDFSAFPEMRSEIEPLHPMVSSCHCTAQTDIPIGMTSKFANFELKPIITKTSKVKQVSHTRMVSARNDEKISHFSSKEQKTINSVKKLSIFNNNSTGVKLKTDSPRIANKRFLQAHHPKSVSSGGARRSLASFAVVKTSQDPLKDFKDSMAEMITENDIKTSKDLEDLLACYLSLNSDKYHGLIIGAFKQIWFEITDK